MQTDKELADAVRNAAAEFNRARAAATAAGLTVMDRMPSEMVMHSNRRVEVDRVFRAQVLEL